MKKVSLFLVLAIAAFTYSCNETAKTESTETTQPATEEAVAEQEQPAVETAGETAAETVTETTENAEQPATVNN